MALEILGQLLNTYNVQLYPFKSQSQNVNRVIASNNPTCLWICLHPFYAMQLADDERVSKQSITYINVQFVQCKTQVSRIPYLATHGFLDCMCNHTLVPLLGLCNKICPHGRHGEWRPFLRQSGGPAASPGRVVFTVRRGSHLREEDYRTVLGRCWSNESW